MLDIQLQIPKNPKNMQMIYKDAINLSYKTKVCAAFLFLFCCNDYYEGVQSIIDICCTDDIAKALIYTQSLSICNFLVNKLCVTDYLSRYDNFGLKYYMFNGSILRYDYCYVLSGFDPSAARYMLNLNKECLETIIKLDKWTNMRMIDYSFYSSSVKIPEMMDIVLEFGCNPLNTLERPSSYGYKYSVEKLVNKVFNSGNIRAIKILKETGIKIHGNDELLLRNACKKDN